MNILDSQFHFGPGRIDETLAAMNALGITAVLIDEHWRNYIDRYDPGYARADPGLKLGEGVYRPIQPTAELAAILHPKRFSYLVRLGRNDREVGAVIRMARDNPAARALRITPSVWPLEAKSFAEGGYDDICAAACDAGLPLFIFAPDQAQLIREYAGRFPNLRIVFDHCGVMGNRLRSLMFKNENRRSREELVAAFDDVLRLADLPNVALKWSHAPETFELPNYPGEQLWPILRKALKHFGAERVMWASDASASPAGETWGELLFAMIGNADLLQAEREAVLGGTARRWLNWPAD